MSDFRRIVHQCVPNVQIIKTMAVTLDYYHNEAIIDAAINNESDDDKTREPKPLFAYNKELLKTLECPACLESMCTYIFLCETGHSICQACRKQLRMCPSCDQPMTNKRNFMLEAISENLFFPCTHLSCPKYVKRKNFVPHFLDCDYKITTCILDKQCKWTGSRIGLKEHILQKHASKSWMRSENLDKWKESTTNNVQAILAYDKLFYVYMKRVDVHNDPRFSAVYWGLQYIGPSEEAKHYQLSMNIYSDLSNRNIQFRESCHNHKLNFNQIIETGQCVSLSLKKLRTFLNQYNCVFFKLTVIKLNE